MSDARIEPSEGAPAIVLREWYDGIVLMRECACKNCGEPFVSRAAYERHFCTKACKKTDSLRRQSRGLAIIRSAMKWRGKQDLAALADLCARLSEFLEQDKRAGRPSW